MVLLVDTATPGNSREIFSEDAVDGTRTRNPSVINCVLLPLNYTAQKSIAFNELSLPSCCFAYLYIYHFSTVINFSSEKYSSSTGHRNSWYQ